MDRVSFALTVFAPGAINAVVLEGAHAAAADAVGGAAVRNGVALATAEAAAGTIVPRVVWRDTTLAQLIVIVAPRRFADLWTDTGLVALFTAVAADDDDGRHRPKDSERNRTRKIRVSHN